LAEVREVDVNGVRWLVREDLADFLQGCGALDAWKLAGHPSARVVDKARGRVIFTVSLPRDGDDPLRLTVTRFERPRLRDLVRALLGGSRAPGLWRTAGVLESIGIRTPRRVAVGVRRSAGVLRDDCYICETASGVTALDDFVAGALAKASPAERGRMLRRAVPLLAGFVRQLHDHGVRHRDLDAHAVAVEEQEGGAWGLMLVDLEGVRCGGALPVGARLRELAQLGRFFSTAVSRTTRHRFWKTYVRGIPFLEHHREAYARLLAEQVARVREASYRAWERRCLGTNRDFRRFDVRGVRGCMVRGRIELSDEVLSRIPERGLVMPDAVVWKDSDTTQVWEQRLDFGTEVRTIVIKRKKPREGMRFARTFLRRVGALREWQKAHAMKVRGLPVADVLAAFEKRSMGLLYDTYLITEKVEGAESLQRFVERVFSGGVSVQRARLRRRMARALGTVIRRVHDAGFCHRDLKPDNILVRVGDAGPDDFDFTLIDFEGVWRRKVREQDRARDIGRIAAMFVEGDAVRTTDMMHFLDGYLKGHPVSRERRRRFFLDVQRCAWEKRAAWKARGYLS